MLQSAPLILASLPSDNQFDLHSNTDTMYSIYANSVLSQPKTKAKRSKVALDNGQYQYMVYNPYIHCDNGRDYDYYSNQYHITPLSDSDSAESSGTNCAHYKNSSIHTNKDTVSKIAKDFYDGPESKIAADE